MSEKNIFVIMDAREFIQNFVFWSF